MRCSASSTAASPPPTTITGFCMKNEPSQEAQWEMPRPRNASSPGTIERSELDSARAKLLKVYDSPDTDAAQLPSYALNLLTGHRHLTPDEHRAELAAVTLADLRDVARELYSTALLQVPGRGADWAGFTEAPQWSTGTVMTAGSRHRSLESDSVLLTVSPDAVSLSTADGPVIIRATNLKPSRSRVSA